MLYIPCGDGATKSRTATLFPNEAAAGGIKHKFHSETKEGKKAEAPSSLVPNQEGGKAGRMGNGRRRGRNGRWKGEEARGSKGGRRREEGARSEGGRRRERGGGGKSHTFLAARQTS